MKDEPEEEHKQVALGIIKTVRTEVLTDNKAPLLTNFRQEVLKFISRQGDHLADIQRDIMNVRQAVVEAKDRLSDQPGMATLDLVHQMAGELRKEFIGAVKRLLSTTVSNQDAAMDLITSLMEMVASQTEMIDALVRIHEKTHFNSCSIHEQTVKAKEE